MSRPKDVHPAIYDLTKRFCTASLAGPPMSDKVVRLIDHSFTPGEAMVAVQLPSYYGKPLKAIAKKVNLNIDEVQAALDSMSEKRVILKTVRDGQPTYALLPIVPGMFEMALMNGSDTDWHRKFAYLFEDLFATGYMRDSASVSLPGVRSIPIETSLPSESEVVSTDRFSELLDKHNDFGMIAVCQCRQSMYFTDHKCKKAGPEFGCLTFGTITQTSIDDGVARRLSREEMKDVAAERYERGLILFTGNVKFSSPNAICTCCDCCCGFLRAINDFGLIGMVAPSHFIAKVDDSLCDNCGKCVKKCNTHAHTLASKKHSFDPSKCIGCGYCVASCKPKAIKMVDNPKYKGPSENFRNLLLKLAPSATMAVLKTKISRAL